MRNLKVHILFPLAYYIQIISVIPCNVQQDMVASILLSRIQLVAAPPCATSSAVHRVATNQLLNIPKFHRYARNS